MGPPRGQCFECRQEGHFRRECPFMNCSYVQAWAAGPQARKRGPSRLLFPVWVNGTVDSSCSHTILRSRLVGSPDTVSAPIYLQCTQGDVWSFLVTKVQLEVEGHEETCWVVLVITFAYPVILGRVCRWFGEILKQQPPTQKQTQAHL